MYQQTHLFERSATSHNIPINSTKKHANSTMLDANQTQFNAISFASNREDKDELKKRYKQSGRVHITDFLELQSAKKIHDTLAKQKEWNLAWNDRGKHTDLSYTGVEKWTEDQRRSLTEIIHSQAEDSFQYFYSAIPIYDIYQNNLLPGHFFNQIYEFFNSRKFLDFIRDLLDAPNIRYADMQATRYSKGHFLTEHDDGVEGKNRIAAYVLNLTPKWRTDWGGALVFSEEQDSENKVLYPKFNALNIFSVPQKHSVSYVTPFATQERYSITGWFRY